MNVYFINKYVYSSPEFVPFLFDILLNILQLFQLILQAPYYPLHVLQVHLIRLHLLLYNLWLPIHTTEFTYWHELQQQRTQSLMFSSLWVWWWIFSHHFNCFCVFSDHEKPIFGEHVFVLVNVQPEFNPWTTPHPSYYGCRSNISMSWAIFKNSIHPSWNLPGFSHIRAIKSRYFAPFQPRTLCVASGISLSSLRKSMSLLYQPRRFRYWSRSFAKGESS